MKFLNSHKGQLLLGLLAGLLMIALAATGNPKNMAICTACFIRDTAGAMKFHSNEVTQYFRPEVLGLMFGSFILAKAKGEYRSTTSKNVVIQFVLGNILMIAALVFLGCTLRLFLRLAAGEIAALIGLVGLIAGVYVGGIFVKRGYTLGDKSEAEPSNGYIFPFVLLLAFIITILAPDLFALSTKGPGSMHAPKWIALLASLGIGAIAYQTRLCFTGSFRDAIMFKEYTRVMPIIGIFLAMLVYNIVVGDFSIIMAGPVAHTQFIWNILAMFVVGFAGVLAGGCPVRQIIMAGAGSTDAIMNVIGMFTGSALAHNFALASGPSTPEAAGGPGLNGKIAIFVCLAILLIIAYYGEQNGKKQEA